MMEEELPLPPANPTYFYLDNKDVDELQEENILQSIVRKKVAKEGVKQACQ